MNVSELAVRTLARLGEIPNITVHDGDVLATPAGRYVCFYDDNPLAVNDGRYRAEPGQDWWVFRVMCVARTAEGLRALVTSTQRKLVWWSPAEGERMIRQLSAGPQLWEGDGGERRASSTLTFRLVTSRPLQEQP